jgi:very-short-patch-repair endonuclease
VVRNVEGEQSLKDRYIYFTFIVPLNSAKHSGHLHLGSHSQTHEQAKQLRHTSTPAEDKLWSLLRNRQLKGKKFRRQHALADYIADFYCHECKLVIELDGQFHKEEEAKQYDAARTRLLSEYGLTVLRFWNTEVINQPEKVLERIATFL